MLTHFDPLQDISVSADASAYGVGAVLFHTDASGSKRALSFAFGVL